MRRIQKILTNTLAGNRDQPGKEGGSESNSIDDLIPGENQVLEKKKRRTRLAELSRVVCGQGEEGGRKRNQKHTGGSRFIRTNITKQNSFVSTEFPVERPD